MENNNPYLIIFYHNSDKENILDKEPCESVPDDRLVVNAMQNIGSNFAELLYDAYENDGYDVKICEYIVSNDDLKA
jgi:hypothetical protein